LSFLLQSAKLAACAACRDSLQPGQKKARKSQDFRAESNLRLEETGETLSNRPSDVRFIMAIGDIPFDNINPDEARLRAPGRKKFLHTAANVPDWRGRRTGE
jgi:hypothetical protein